MSDRDLQSRTSHDHHDYPESETESFCGEDGLDGSEDDRNDSKSSWCPGHVNVLEVLLETTCTEAVLVDKVGTRNDCHSGETSAHDRASRHDLPSSYHCDDPWTATLLRVSRVRRNKTEQLSPDSNHND